MRPFLQCLLLCLLLPLLSAAAPADIFSGYSGTVILYDLQTKQYSGLNQAQWDVGALPASTFKIPNSLIGLESGVIPNIDFVIPWDRVKRPIEAWNQDHTLKSAFAVSCVPYYQELARRVGFARMQDLVGKLDYGSMDVRAGNLDEFWLRGYSRITPRQQLQFLTRLIERKLPFSQRSQDLVESIMLRESKPAYQYFGKSGWAFEGKHETGWFVGFVRRGPKAWAFASRLEADSPDAAKSGPASEAAAKSWLRGQGLID
nr:ClassD_beta_lactamase [uncultured bacterium]